MNANYRDERSAEAWNMAGPYSAPATSVHFPPEQLQYSNHEHFQQLPNPYTQTTSMLSYHHIGSPSREHFHHPSDIRSKGANEMPDRSPSMYYRQGPANDRPTAHPSVQSLYMVDSSGPNPYRTQSQKGYEECEYRVSSTHLMPQELLSASPTGLSPLGSEASLASDFQLSTAGTNDQNEEGSSRGLQKYAAMAQQATFMAPKSQRSFDAAGSVASQSRSNSLSGSAGLEDDSRLAIDVADPAQERLGGLPAAASEGQPLETAVSASPLSPTFENEGFKATANGTPFISKLLHLLSNDKYRDYIRWNKAGDAFILSHTNQYFASQVLPIFFRHSNCASFIRQLNLYQFSRLPVMQLLQNLDDDGTGHLGTTAPSSCFSGFSHPYFKRGQEETYHLIKPKQNKTRDRSASSAAKKSKLAAAAEGNRGGPSLHRATSNPSSSRQPQIYPELPMAPRSVMSEGTQSPQSPFFQANYEHEQGGGHSPLFPPVQYQTPHAIEGHPVYYRAYDETSHQMVPGQSGSTTA